MVSVPTSCEHNPRCHQSFSKRELLCLGYEINNIFSAMFAQTHAQKANEAVFSRRVTATRAMSAPHTER